jgi:hypothetical protein
LRTTAFRSWSTASSRDHAITFGHVTVTDATEPPPRTRPT